MAKLLWAKVYFQEHFAGCLKEEPGQSTSFVYDSTYLNSGKPAIAFTLPLREKPYVSRLGLLPYFDNLVSEGWMEKAQVRLLGKRQSTRFELLLAFGADCPGAISIIDPEPTQLSMPTYIDSSLEMAALTNRASLSGVQPKIALIKENRKFRPSKLGEISTHIAKLPSHNHADLVANEYITTLAIKALLPNDETPNQHIASVSGIAQETLIIERFDRRVGGRIHFEEFNQLLGLMSTEKYEGAYKDMSDLMRSNPAFMPAEIYKLFVRILAGLLLGNTDMHFKNFAVFHTLAGFRLTPNYDQVAAALYGYKDLALKIGNASNLQITQLKPENILKLGEEFNLSHDAIHMAYSLLSRNKSAAIDAVNEANFGTNKLKKTLIDSINKRWNGTFALIGKKLSKKP